MTTTRPRNSDYIAGLRRELHKRLWAPSKEFVYRGAADFVLHHGDAYTPQRPRAFVGARGHPKACYGNAIILSAMYGWRYVEGYAMSPFMQIVNHAWNLDERGALIDNTWGNRGLAYIGVVFAVERAEEATWDGDGSVLLDEKRGDPLLREPWTGETEPWPRPNRFVELIRMGNVKEAYEWMKVRT